MERYFDMLRYGMSKNAGNAVTPLTLFFMKTLLCNSVVFLTQKAIACEEYG